MRGISEEGRMKAQIIILHGDNEHGCIQEDNGTCSSCCPCLCTPEGYTHREARILGRSTKGVKCAIGQDGHEPHTD